MPERRPAEFDRIGEGAFRRIPRIGVGAAHPGGHSARRDARQPRRTRQVRPALARLLPHADRRKLLYVPPRSRLLRRTRRLRGQTRQRHPLLRAFDRRRLPRTAGAVAQGRSRRRRVPVGALPHRPDPHAAQQGTRLARRAGDRTAVSPDTRRKGPGTGAST